MNCTHPFRWARYQLPLCDPRCKASHLLFSLHISSLSPERRQGRICSLLFITWNCCGQWSCDTGKRTPACYGRTGLITQKWLPCSVLQAWVPQLEQHRNGHFHGRYLKLSTQKEECSSTPCTNKLLLTERLSFHFHFFFGPFNNTYFLFLHFSLPPQIGPNMVPPRVCQGQCSPTLRSPAILRPLWASNKLQVLW